MKLLPVSDKLEVLISDVVRSVRKV